MEIMVHHVEIGGITLGRIIFKIYKGIRNFPPRFKINRVASFSKRQHHQYLGENEKIGGITLDNMPQFSKPISEERVSIKHFKLIEGGIFQE